MFSPKLLFAFIFFVGFTLSATLLPDEVASLQVIAKSLGKTDWNFSVDPCSGLAGWVTQNPPKGEENAVTCNCTFVNNTVCHVVSITLKTQNLHGTVPRELVRLPFLQAIDLTRNYLNGTIPSEWGSMKLVTIALLGNRITGPLPIELANISTLANLTLESNQLSGTIPPQFGNFLSIEKLLLSSNNLTGTLPETLAKLATLKDFRVSDNKFTGTIPNFIQNWTYIEKLVIHASGLSGPIPSAINSLTSLTDLRISDLNGNVSAFPDLSRILNLTELILRSCNIVGQVPTYMAQLKKLKTLDLSFNKLSGQIPVSFENLIQTDNIYLTGNSLSGPIPAWMLKSRNKIDLSYNNFTYDISGSGCQTRDVNLFAASKGNTSGIVSCLRSDHCNEQRSSVYIKCGGTEVRNDTGTNFESDGSSVGSSTYSHGNSNWGFSSTGHFLDNDTPDSYIWSNSSKIVGPNSQLYRDARLSPLSLTYYAFCMVNGSYTVNLHFAEIIFKGDKLGMRLFDVYIQGKPVLIDFNIEDEAGGVNIGIKRNFTVNITDGTLDIRFYWAGKGSTAIPRRGVYGPLISAISVDPNFTPSSPNTNNPKNSISTGAIVGIVLASVLITVLLILGVVWWMARQRLKDTLEYELRNVELHTGSFTLRQIKAATNNFDRLNKIGEGGFGPVYKGLLLDGTAIAVKQLSAKSKQGNREFVNEIGMISALQHPHLVKLYGCCIEGNQLLLVYEYLENNSLARALFGPEEHQLHLDWPIRRKISIGIARGLAYLHEESRLKIVHRDIKSNNVLLGKNLDPKISDFGLAKLDEEDKTHISTRIAGTYGYMAPEYAMHGYLTDKADVYSFGVVLLEIVSGWSITSIRPKEDRLNLLDWARSLKEDGNLMALVDPRLESNFNKNEVIAAINIALHCTNAVSTERPTMSSVVSVLEGRANVKEFIASSTDQTDPKEIVSDEDKVANLPDYGKGQSVSVDVIWNGSSASTSDLYPVSLDSDYWEKGA